jgi:epoxyqueuosine reductase QueG
MNAQVSRFLEDLFDSSELNRLPAEYGGHRIFRKPTIGVVAGNDPIIEKFKEVVCTAHLTPAEMWSKSASSKKGFREFQPLGRPTPDAGTWTDLAELSARLKVLSVVFPYTRSILEEGSRSTRRTPLTGLALNWAHAFHTEVYEKTAQFVVERGFRVLVPQHSRFHSVLLRMSSPHVVSAWSERHYAFAAGLGTFGLAEHLITEHGCNVRLASFVTDGPLEITPRVSDDPFANCLYFAKGVCAKCSSRCPGRALTKNSHNKLLCEVIRQRESARVRSELAPLLKPIKRRFMYVPVEERPIGCAVCQYDVPCMDKNPMAGRSEAASH